MIRQRYEFANLSSEYLCAKPEGLWAQQFGGYDRAVHLLDASHVGRSFFSTSDGNDGIPPHNHKSNVNIGVDESASCVCPS
jgi:hypothetical protein